MKLSRAFITLLAASTAQAGPLSWDLSTPQAGPQVVSSNTQVGWATLLGNTTGGFNNALGFFSMFANQTGNANVAIGYATLANNVVGNQNTAVGADALYFNTASNNTALGYSALRSNTTGTNNVAIGLQALFSNTTGSQNTAIGFGAGVNLTTGSSNICIGNAGVAAESGAIRIGTPGTHTRTVLSGQVGIGTTEPSSTLHVEGAVSTADTVTATPQGHAVLIKTNGDYTAGLAIQSKNTFTHNSGDNFITFFKGSGPSIGSIEGNGVGSVVLSSAGSDYAEYLPKADPSKSFSATEIVGVRDGQIVGQGEKADQFMVITGQAIVAGNRPSEDEADLAKRGLVSFIGQVPVQVRGKVNSGDFILSSENGDGTGIALSASDIPPSAMHRVVGRAWEGSTEEGLKVVNTAVGLDQTSLVAPALERLERENRELRAALKAKDEALEARLALLEQAISGSAKAVKVALSK